MYHTEDKSMLVCFYYFNKEDFKIWLTPSGYGRFLKAIVNNNTNIYFATSEWAPYYEREKEPESSLILNLKEHKYIYTRKIKDDE